MPQKRRSLDDVLRIAEDVLRASRVDHVFVGGVTVLAFGMPRTITNVHVIASIDVKQIPKIVAGFQKSGFFVSAQDLHDALTEGGHVTVQDKRSTYRIDLVPASTAANQETLRTRRHVAWRRLRLPMAAPEHTIVMKLRWGSEQDLEDALGIYVRQEKTLDLRVMRNLARRHGVTRELKELEERARNLSA